ncbi:MAG: amino acid ABC transporter permease [Burkholderiaceae bacterium]
MFASEKLRGVFWQVLLLVAVVVTGWYLVSNTLYNLEQRQIRVGFEFLDKEAGFEISESRIAFDASRSYFRAFLAGLANTLWVSFFGIVLATIVGTLIGIARLSSNWLLARLASVYVEVFRNVPLLLQLLAWYTLFTELLPGVRQSISLGGLAFINQRGFRFAFPVAHPGWDAAGIALLFALLAIWVYRRWARQRQARTGQQAPVGWVSLGLVVGLPFMAWLLWGAPTELDVPALRGFNFRGGQVLTPEFTALLLGLSIYTAAFIAEVVRAGIMAVDKGQTEAGMALGLSPGQRLRLIILPQALRVIIPPLTSQYLNLTKNSSLAVAIGYPDLVAVANTSMNQTGQAIEAIAILMAVYLTISLLIALFMNWYNGRVRLVER